MKVGLIGCGRISKAYCKNIARHGVVELAAAADLRREAAEERAKEFNIPRVLTTEELLNDPEIDIVMNLTVPQAHYPVALAALNAGKHVYNEKPFSVTRDEGRKLLETAKAKNLRVSCAPDTFLGEGLQTCRRWIDAGKIGQPIAAEALFSLYPGPRSFDAFFWKTGGGILMDMGPYYLTALTVLLGPVKRLASSTRKNPAPMLRQQDPDWEKKVEVPTHAAAVIDFHSGVTCNFAVSYEVTEHYGIHFRIQGTEGTLHVPDPNGFGGAVKITKLGKEVESHQTEGPNAQEGRGLGIADMAQAIAENRPHRVSGEIALHVLDVMNSIVESSAAGKFVELQTTMSRPEPMPQG